MREVYHFERCEKPIQKLPDKKCYDDMNDTQRLHTPIRDKSPCYKCPERFTACSDKCPKDERGDIGYKAWKAEIDRVKAVRQEYIQKVNKKYVYYRGNE